MAGLPLKKRNFSLLLVLLLATLLLFTSFGAQTVKADGPSNPSIYYVAPGGNDSNPSTESLPWKTITKAANTLIAGDTVYIKSGTYNERVIPQNSGSAGKYITYSAYPGDTVIIDGSDIALPDWAGLFQIDTDYIKVSGLKITNSSDMGCLVRPNHNHIIIENCIISNCQSSGILAEIATDMIVDGNEITNVCQVGNLEMISLSDVDGFEIKNNYIHNCPRQPAIDVKDGCRNGKIYGNSVHDITVGGVGVYVDAYSKASYNIEVFRNRISNCTNGIGLNTEEGGTLTDIKVYNNIVYGCPYNLVIWKFETPGSHLKKNIIIPNYARSLSIMT